MIRPSSKFDLGADKTRIKDPRDAARQQATVDALLARLYGDDPNRRWEIQIVADEVGMGKTYVALATAFSVLDHLRGKQDPALGACYRKVVIVTPSNAALFSKWLQEVREFVRRCVTDPEERDAVRPWFSPEPVGYIDDLAWALRRRGGKSPSVIVTRMSTFRGKNIRDFRLKRRVLLGALFRHWGTRFRHDARRRLLRGAPKEWPRDPQELTEVTDRQWQALCFEEKELLRTIRTLDRPSQGGAAGLVEDIRQRCREAARPYNRERRQTFDEIEKQLTRLYREIVARMIRQAVPLVIVDEAHNWKNGPSSGTHGFRGFERFLAPRTRRLLMLTATPFQLHPREMLELIRVGEVIDPEPSHAEAEVRRERIRRQRQEVIAPVLRNAAVASERFARQWSRLPPGVTTEALARTWRSDAFRAARQELHRIAYLEGVVDTAALERIVESAVAPLDPGLRAFAREALRLYTFNADLSQEMGAFVIRHRRRTDHRLYLVGSEYAADTDATARRPDRHVLHGAPGLDVRGEGELPHYLLMRFVSEVKGGRGRTSLGSALTGCYSTLLHSAEGSQLHKATLDSPVGQVYLRLLRELVDESQDARHPKVKQVLEQTLESWRAGEKTLIFCFRTNTARRLRQLINLRIREELEARKRTCLGGERNLRSLRSRLTGRDRDLAGLVLDRVLWSHAVARGFGPAEVGYRSEDLRLRREDIVSLAEISLQYGVDLLARRPDRVFLTRAVEHVLARRILGQGRPKAESRKLLERIADPAWVSRPYGVEQGGAARKDDVEGAAPPAPPAERSGPGAAPQPDAVASDERGPLTVYEPIQPRPSGEAVDGLANALEERRRLAARSGQVPLLDSYAEQPSLWFGPKPADLASAAPGDPVRRVVTQIHKHVWGLMDLEAGGAASRDNEDSAGSMWRARAAVFGALRRVLLRESVLLRLLPARADLEESSWADLLIKAFFRPLPNQMESMADRVAVFLEDLEAASGSFDDGTSMRHALYAATRLRDQQFVALVDGSVSAEARGRIFAGFNTPLLPEVLICTSVGQEGIDLHRHCRKVVHYDLAWNPAVLEQRTGRTDRIGCKALRERHVRSPMSEGPFLEVGVPFLAGTYDERMYEELRLRAQVFEVLTGGDLALDSPEGRDDVSDAEGSEASLHYTPLPDVMVEDLRVRLTVWEDVGPGGMDRAIRAGRVE